MAPANPAVAKCSLYIGGYLDHVNRLASNLFGMSSFDLSVADALMQSLAY